MGARAVVRINKKEGETMEQGSALRKQLLHVMETSEGIEVHVQGDITVRDAIAIMAKLFEALDADPLDIQRELMLMFSEMPDSSPQQVS